MIFLIVLLNLVQSNCPCQDYQTQQYCIINDHCQWTDNQCQKKECSAIQTEQSCKYPDCFMDINQCKQFTDCSEIAANDCLEYPGCHPNLGICTAFTQCNQLTSALNCGGAKTTDGHRCYWLRNEKQCASYKECSEVSVENCDQVGFECDIDTVSNTCQIPGYIQNCSTLQNKEQCNEQFSNQLCYWMNEKCERVKCNSLEQPNCNGICSWTGENCKNCIDSEDTNGQLIQMIIVAFILIS